MDIPPTEEEARSHIRLIRHAKGLDGPETNTSDLENALIINKTLRIDCNEIGFGKSNVEAICKIGRSTKASLGNTTRYIGEKGIGFKSVFKVADVVSISSGHYSFKFDKKETLGMIAPIWDEFPDFRLPNNTSVLLQLSADYDTGELEDELKSLTPDF
ncbi:unnamed protein product [Alternaria alternata]